MKNKSKISLLMMVALFTASCNTDRMGDLKEGNEVADLKSSVSSDSSKPIPGQYIVVLNDGVLNANGLEVAKSTDGGKESYERNNNVLLSKMRSNEEGLKLGIDNQKISSVFGNALEGFVAKNLTDADVELLKKDSKVQSIEQDYLVTLLEKPAEETIASKAVTGQETPWGITRVGGAGNGVGKTAWVIDSGIDLDHPDLNVNTQKSKSFIGDNNPDDGHGHGTHVAGTIAAINNDIGVVGVAAGATVVSLKVVNSLGQGSPSTWVSALDYVYVNASAGDVVNMSVGAPKNTAVDATLLKVAKKGIKIAVAAGNSYDNANNYSPARVNHANIYTISAIAQGDFWTYFSSYGTCVDYAAPGYKVKSTSKNGGYHVDSGTSMASPHAAGVVLLGSPTADGSVKAAYWEHDNVNYSGNYGATNTYSLSHYRYDKDGTIDKIIHR
ncbi:Peptidase inhibitor I9 [Chryseobacterium oleae]|uniref:Peptidase inhibitor I9 n=1 Tax=Chryseobacterium oleae TaxID=491207 RepID=A0A1I4W6B1_CHROL|nr:S8 family serine peptidase [Chryseobacterium oleae]SFN08790.1 Peptidase inhibitor I9 [Chryseobacterium oleae]